MSSWHRHNPEFADEIDGMFGVTPLTDARPDVDIEQATDDIEVLSSMALTPVEDAWKAYELLKLMVAARYDRRRLTEHFRAAEALVGQEEA